MNHENLHTQRNCYNLPNDFMYEISEIEKLSFM